MREFMGEDFLLKTEVSRELYEIAKKMPIIDYHCHLNAGEILDNRRYKNITELWLEGDHYKWRAMRSNGIEEKYITGDASDFEKFKMWAKTVSDCIGNPLYHWTHLELQRYFDIKETLNEETAEMIWDKCNAKIESGEIDVRRLIEKSEVEYIGTTDDPIDSLENHIALAKEGLSFKVAPTFRPDRVLKIKMKTFKSYIEQLEERVEKDINSIDDLTEVLENRVKFFKEVGCNISDHSLEVVFFMDASKEEVNDIFIKAKNEEELTYDEEKKYFTFMMKKLGEIYVKYDLVMQVHIGALRNNNTKMFNRVGADAGFDSINDREVAEPLSALLDNLNKENNLPRTILYCLNPKDNEVIGTMIGNFQEGNGVSKIQFGSGWWFNDQKDGMVRQLTALSQLGLLSKFVGMLTDSRSFLSYTRHEYFRRILCNFIGNIVEDGEYPYDSKKLKDIIENICYFNSKEYFNIHE
ncbi:glucuronate isomerase [uncultured Clostridium sp.]|uniref:glucuronate isomerase n=1 Tax=uncultured Clostridium sp. TaxID=59620 RepID=UPI00262009FD|nr:glucuronate isomerase [uncultured Clostridium sp.]